VQRVDDILRVVLAYIGIGKNGDPVTAVAFWRLYPVHAETTRETGDTTKDGLEGFSEMMRDVVFEYCTNQR